MKKPITIISGLLAALAWSWIFLIDVAQLTDSRIMGYGIIVMSFALIVGLTTLVTVKTFEFLKPRLVKPKRETVLILVLVWAATELLISWLVTVIWMGFNGNWDNIMSFYSLTPIVMVTPLRYLARVFGYFGTSAIVGTGIILIVSKNFRKFALTYWLIILLINGGLWLTYRQATGMPTEVTIVSESLSQVQTVDPGDSRLVLFPEYGLDSYTSENISERFVPDAKSTAFSGTFQRQTDSGIKNVLVYGRTDSGFEIQQAKSRLIPAGEYLPFLIEAGLRTTKSPAYDEFMFSRAVIRGTDKSTPFEVEPGFVLGNAACSSIINPEDYRKLTNQGSTVLANSASLEIFSGSRVFEMYHDGFAKFMATANARPFLQSTNDWKAFALDHSGNTISTLNEIGSQNVTIQPNTKKTPYNFLGEWVAIIGFAYLIQFFVRKKYHANRKTKKSTTSK